MEGIFNAVLITSLYATIVGLAVIILKGILRNRLSPQWHYLIWIVLVIKLLVPFGPESAVSLFNIVPHFSENKVIENPGEAQIYNNIILPAENTVTYEMPVLPDAENIDVSKIDDVQAKQKNILSYLWLAGALLTLLWLLYTYLSLYRKLRKRTYDVDKRISNIFELCKRRIGVNRKITLKIQDAINTPALFGVINPRILLTPEITKLSDKEIEYVLLHELAHYKRKDTLANYLLLAFQVIHWFNPVMWYCFKLIRQDMEVATDERVLSILHNTEHRDYGRALIAILENFSRPMLAPRLLGMADDRKSIERRLKMIKMAGFFKSKKNITIVVGVLCVLILGGMFLTNGISADNKKKNNSENTNLNSLNKADELYQHRSKYIGDASNVGNLLNKLPLAEYKIGIALHTEAEPYGITVNYNLENNDIDSQQIKSLFDNNALILFALIENLDNIMFNPTDPDSRPGYKPGYSYSREECQKSFDNDLWEYSKDIKAFEGFLENLSIIEDNSKPQSQKPNNLDDAVSDAIKEQNTSYRPGEYVTEGHIILDKEEKDGTVKVYTMASIGSYGFENGIFTNISGSGAIPTVMTFSIDENGGYSLLKYEEPMDGKGYTDSIKKMFPQRLHNKMLSAHEKYQDIVKQKEKQAEDYLKSIGRTSKVSKTHVEKIRPDIDSEARDELFSVYNKFDIFLNTCPDWIGTREYIENGIRYIYETSQSKTSDGYDLITFKKTKENGRVVEERKYKIVGIELQLVGYTSESEESVSFAEEDKVKAIDVITKYFYAFAQADYKEMSTFATARHNKEYIHDGDVWGMKWAMPREIKMVVNPEFLRIENNKSTLVFGVSVYMETVKTSAQYPSKQTFFYVILEKGDDGNWRVDRYTTG